MDHYEQFLDQEYDPELLDQILDSRVRLAQYEDDVTDAARVIADLLEKGSLWLYAEKLRQDSNEALFALAQMEMTAENLPSLRRAQEVVDRWVDFCKWVHDLKAKMEDSEQLIEDERAMSNAEDRTSE